MTKRLAFLCTFCAVTLFSLAQEKFLVKGVANEELNNQYLYLCKLDDGEKAKEIVLDSAIVKKEKFSFSGVHQMRDIAFIKDIDGETYPLILEKGKISINIGTNERGGTPLNDSLNVALNRMKPIKDALLKTGKELDVFFHSVEKEEFLDKITNDSVFRAKWDQYGVEATIIKDSIIHCISDYKNSIVGVYLFVTGAGILTVEDIEKMMEEASPVFTQHIMVKYVIDRKKLFEQRMKEEEENNLTDEQREDRRRRSEMDAKIKIGQHFTDAKIKELNGGVKLLSDYVGKGKYVLIDFWASWCGPCRHEMPNVKAAYEKYAAKGFEVISISIDKKLKDWRVAVEELGLTWPQLLNVDAADAYGVYAIPTTFLIDPEGIVIERDLREKRLEEVLSTLLKCKIWLLVSLRHRTRKMFLISISFVERSLFPSFITFPPFQDGFRAHF